MLSWDFNFLRHQGDGEKEWAQSSDGILAYSKQKNKIQLLKDPLNNVIIKFV